MRQALDRDDVEIVVNLTTPAAHAAGTEATLATPDPSELALHVLDAMLATSESIERRAFVGIDSGFDPIAPLPESWDPTERLV